MPLPKKLTNAQVYDLVSKFFDGYSVKTLSAHYSVSRQTITRILERKTYKDCPHLNILVSAIGLISYLEQVDTQMAANRRTGRGNRKELT